VPAGEERPGYAPNRKKQYIARQNTSKNLQKNKTAVSKTIDLSTKTPDFSSLKNQITEYEARAKEMYGLSFEIVKAR
jgi:phage shock protein A